MLMTGIEPNNTFTLYDACKATNVGFDYPEDSKASQLSEETNKKIALIGIQSLQRKREQNLISEEEFQNRMDSFQNWMELGLSELTLKEVTNFIGDTKEPVSIGKAMR